MYDGLVYKIHTYIYQSEMHDTFRPVNIDDHDIAFYVKFANFCCITCLALSLILI